MTKKELQRQIDNTNLSLQKLREDFNIFFIGLTDYLGICVDVGKKVSEDWYAGDRIVTSYTFSKAKKTKKTK